MDCNETCARIFGFDSKVEMLQHSAWELYFYRNEREDVLDRLRRLGTCSAEEVCLRGKNDVPACVLATRTVVSYMNGEPKLLQGTIVDPAMARRAPAGSKEHPLGFSVMIPTGKNVHSHDISRRCAALLQTISKALPESDHQRISRAEIRACTVAIEQMKMLMSEWEICALFGD